MTDIHLVTGDHFIVTSWSWNDAKERDAIIAYSSFTAKKRKSYLIPKAAIAYILDP